MKKSIVEKALIALLIVSVILPSLAYGLWLYQKKLLSREKNHALPLGAYASPALEAEFESGSLRSDIQKENEKRLATYGWIDKEKSLVHIPIERAMQLIIERQTFRETFEATKP